MTGSASPVRFRGPTGQEFWEVGLLDGVVFEAANLDQYDPDTGTGGSTITRYFAVELDQNNGRMPAAQVNSANQGVDTGMVIAVKPNVPDLFADDAPLIGVSLDTIRPGRTGRIAGPGCIVPVQIHVVWDAGGRYVVSGDGIDGAGIANTIRPGRTLGFVCAPRIAATNADWCGVFIHPM